MNKDKNNIISNSKAFSLIELSIVILIIGILVAGVTSSSRLLKQMKLVKKFERLVRSMELLLDDQDDAVGLI